MERLPLILEKVATRWLEARKPGQSSWAQITTLPPGEGPLRLWDLLPILFVLLLLLGRGLSRLLRLSTIALSVTCLPRPFQDAFLFPATIVP